MRFGKATRFAPWPMQVAHPEVAHKYSKKRVCRSVLPRGQENKLLKNKNMTKDLDITHQVNDAILRSVKLRQLDQLLFEGLEVYGTKSLD